MADLKIATKAFCNTLKSGSFSGDTTQCPTRSMIESAGLTVTGSYASDQLVPEDNIAYLIWEYTFSVSPSSVTIPATGGSRQYTVTSYKIQYSTSSAGSHVEVPGSKTDVGYTSTNSGDGSWNSANNTITFSANQSTGGKSGSISWKQNESGKSASASYSQEAGSMSYGDITITNATVSDIPASGGSISTGNVSFSQTWGWNGSTTGGGTLTGSTSSPNGASISWTTVSAGSKGTNASDRTSAGTIKVTVSWNGKSASKDVTVYQAKNEITNSSTSWGSWNYTVNVSANPTTLPYSGGTSTITSSGSGTRSGTITHTWSSGSTSTEGTSDSTSGNPTLSTNIGSLSSTTSPSTLTLGENTGGERTATITATWNGKSNTATVKQEAGERGWNYYISISPNTTQSHVAKGGSTEFTISSYKKETINGKEQSSSVGCNWTASINNTTGFSLSPGSGANGGKTTVTSDENKGSSSRSTTLTVKNSEDASKTASVTINQAAGSTTYTYTFSVSPTSLSFPATGDTKSVTVTSYKTTYINGVSQGDTINVPWTASVSGSEYKITSGSSGNNGGTVSVNIGNNATESIRSGTLTISNGGSSSNINVPLSQGAGEFIFTWSDGSTQKDYKGIVEWALGTPEYISVKSDIISTLNGENYTWSLNKEKSDSWLNVDKDHLGYFINPGKNEDLENDRSGFMYFTQSTSNKDIKLKITQEHKKLAPDLRLTAALIFSSKLPIKYYIRDDHGDLQDPVDLDLTRNSSTIDLTGVGQIDINGIATTILRVYSLPTSGRLVRSFSGSYLSSAVEVTDEKENGISYTKFTFGNLLDDPNIAEWGSFELPRIVYKFNTVNNGLMSGHPCYIRIFKPKRV